MASRVLSLFGCSVAGLLLWRNLESHFSSFLLPPNAIFYLGDPPLAWTDFFADAVMGVCYLIIAGSLAFLLFRGRSELPFGRIVAAFALMALGAGGTHLVEAVTELRPDYALLAGFKVFAALAALVAAGLLPLATAQVLSRVHARRLSEEQARGIQLALEEREHAFKVLQENHDALAATVAQRSAELVAANQLLSELGSEKQKTETRLAELSAILESSHDAIYSKDLQGTITSWNRGAEKIFGYASEEIIGRPVSLLTGRDGEREIEGILKRVKRGETIQDLEMTRIAKWGQHLDLSVTVIPLKDSTGSITGVAVVGRDITQEKSLEQQLQQAQRMEAIGRIAGGVAHDFNNMLGVIIGYSELLRERVPVTDPIRNSVDEIKRAAQRAANLTRRLLTFSRQQILDLRVLDLNNVIDNVSSMLRRMVGEDVEVVLSLGESLGSVKMDQSQVEQILMNLAVNARDAMPKGGRLVIETANHELDEVYLDTHPEAHPGKYVVVAVSDTGEGIAAKNLPHIFEPFFTTKAPGQGTGIGLSTVYGIVKQGGGHVWVYSEVDKGTTFKIYLPRVDEEARESSQSSTQAVACGGTETILLAEDEASLRQLTKNLLESSGYTVLEAEDTSQALEIGLQHESNIHLLLTDVIMPGMSGPDLRERLKQRRPDLKALYMSGYADDLIARYGVLEPTTNLILKPFTRNSLLGQIRAALTRGEPRSNPGDTRATV